MENIYKNEKTLFKIAFVISLLFWLALVVGTVGIVFIYILLGFLFYLFVQSGFIAYIKGNALKVSEHQFPELYKQYVECCRKLEMKQKPEIYMLNSDGLLNALATRFLNKTYVILYSDIVDALSKHERALNFYIGHELGHIKRGHIKWSSFLWPAMLLPILGAAYSRSREYSCDLHGLACCDSVLDAAFGLSVLAAGPVKWPKVNLQKYASQTSETGSFWMSYHELVGDYPWLCKRVNQILSKSNVETTDVPRRNIFSWLFALFTPRVGVRGGGAGILVVIAVIGILAAVAIPAYQDYTVRAKTAEAISLANSITASMTPYIQQNRQLPSDLEKIGISNDLSNSVVKSVSVTDAGLQLELSDSVMQFSGKFIFYAPYLDANEAIQWDCSKSTLEARFLPKTCLLR